MPLLAQKSCQMALCSRHLRKEDRMSNDQYAQRLAALTPQQRAALLQQLKRKQSNEAVPDDIIVPQSRTQRSFPLSFAQQRLWFLDQLDPNSPVYNIPQVLRWQGLLDIKCLQQAINTLVERHESLRTNFIIVDGTPRQLIAESRKITLKLVDLRAFPTAECERLALDLTYAAVQAPFHLSTDPLLRITVLRLSEREHFLVFVIHHSISDGWSCSIFFQELFALFEGFVTGKAVRLPPLRIQYADFSCWQRERLRGESLEQHLAYWKQQLAHIPMLQLPFDHPRPAEQTFHGGVAYLTLPEQLTTQLRDLAQREGCTLFMTLLAAFKTLLFRYTSQEDITVGSLIANRTHAEVERLIGFFVNTLVLHTRLQGTLTFRQLLSRVREVCFDAYAHQDLPFERLVDELQPERTLSYSPLFQVLFTLQNVPDATMSLAGLQITQLDLGPTTAKFDLSLFVSEQAHTINIEAEYNSDLFESSTIQRMLVHFQTLLQRCISAPDCRVEQLPLLSSQERQALLYTWNATEMTYADGSCIHQLFAAQAAATPESIVLIYEEQALTFHELDTRSRHLD